MKIWLWLLLNSLLVLSCKVRRDTATLANDTGTVQVEGGAAPEGWAAVDDVQTEADAMGKMREFFAEDPDVNIAMVEREHTGEMLALDDAQQQIGSLRWDRGVASYRNVRAYSTNRDIRLRVKVEVAGNSVGTERAFNFDTKFTSFAFIEAENHAVPVFTGSTSNDRVDALNFRGREWIRHSCLLTAELTITDKASFKTESGADVYFVSIGASQELSAQTQNQHSFARQSPWIVIPATQHPNGVGPNASVIDQICRDYAERMKTDEGLLSDISRRAAGWRYYNSRTTCFEDADCRTWHRGLLPSVVAWTVPRCIVARDNRYCALRSIRRGTCTPSGEYHVPFSYPCDGNMRCENLSRGWWVMRKVNGECR